MQIEVQKQLLDTQVKAFTKQLKQIQKAHWGFTTATPDNVMESSCWGTPIASLI